MRTVSFPYEVATAPVLVVGCAGHLLAVLTTGRPRSGSRRSLYAGDAGIWLAGFWWTAKPSKRWPGQSLGQLWIEWRRRRQQQQFLHTYT